MKSFIRNLPAPAEFFIVVSLWFDPLLLGGCFLHPSSFNQELEGRQRLLHQGGDFSNHGFGCFDMDWQHTRQSYIFGMHWKHDGKLYYDELPAESKVVAAEYFIDHCRDDVSLVRVELVRPDDGER